MIDNFKDYNHMFDIEISSYCQAFCSGCQRNNLDGELNEGFVQQHMGYQDYCVLTDSLSRGINIDFIQFCGEMGDPMMHPQVEQFIDRTFEITDNLLIHTNGGLRQPKWYAHMAEKYKNTNKTLYIKFGIDGCDHDTNWKYRKGVNWQRAMDNLTAWTQAGGGGNWSFLLFDWNWHQIPLATAMAAEIGCKLQFQLTEDDLGLGGMTPEVQESPELIQMLNEYKIHF